MLAHLHHSNTSPTAVICENLQRFGGAPARGEPDPRAVWDETEALAGLDNVLDLIVDEIAPDGTQFADERESLLWGFVNTLHMQARRLDRAIDKLSPKLKDLQRAQDGTCCRSHYLVSSTRSFLTFFGSRLSWDVGINRTG